MDYYGPVSGYTPSQTSPARSTPSNTTSAGMTPRGRTTTQAPTSYSATPSGRYSDQSQQLLQRNQLSQRSGKRQTYIVQEGETLRSIARKTGISEERLRAINNLEKNEIVLPAQKIYLNWEPVRTLLIGFLFLAGWPKAKQFFRTHFYLFRKQTNSRKLERRLPTLFFYAYSANKLVNRGTASTPAS